MTAGGTGVPESIRVLLVEDEPVNRSLVRAIAAKAGARGGVDYELVESDTLAEARRSLAGGRFRAVLLDVHLPDGDGLDLIADVHALGADRPRVVVLSASVHLDDQVRALGAGADMFLGKPIDVRNLVEVLEGLAGESSRPVPSAASRPGTRTVGPA